MKNLRHFKALMRKNFINWKRTPVGTALEILLPICLMIALAIARQRIQPQIVDDLSLFSLRHPLYPIASPINNSWVIDTGPKSFADKNLQAFIQYANYSNLPNNTYAPLLDPLGPYLMFPPQCNVNKGDSKYSSPLIGYIQTGSQLETDLISMMTNLFSLQKQLATQSNITQTQANNQLQSFQQNIQNIATKVSGPSLQGGPEGLKSSDNYQSLGNFTFKAFQNQDMFDQYIQDPRYGTDSMPAICFGFKASENKTINYFELELMFNDETSAEYQSIPSQQNPSASPTQFLPLFVEYTQYSWGGFSYLQNWAANSILKRKSGVPTASIVSMTIPMKSSTLYQDGFQFMLQIGLTAIIFLMYIPPLYRTVFRIVAEKESKVKESMRMMGMTDLSYWLSWFSYYSIINFFVSTLSWGILNYGVFKHSNGFLVWLIMWLFGQSLFSLIIVAQSLFNKARSAAYITTSLYFGLAMMQFLVNSSETNQNLKILASFSPTVALSQSLAVLIQFETTGLGLTHLTISTNYQNFSIKLGLIMLAIDTVIWLLVGFYLEMVLPKEFGKTRHPCFFFKKASKAEKIHQEVETGNSQCFEEVGQDQLSKQSLVINQLYKKFGTVKAINGLSCSLYEDQIFVLLGHNGAGKTTTISVLTGLVEPSSYQSMTVYGLNIEEQMDEVRQIMGVCPQHDVLFDLLTPREHLEIFYDFKCSDFSNRNNQIQKLIRDVGLQDKQQALSYQLSGGNKRKLSVAIALCGNSKFILLDEPTSGMDIATRRQLWNMLEEYKKGRIILLTTHYMDEADILGDRIGIMSKGKLNSLGSSLFLKNRFGVGYHLNLIKKNNEKNQVFNTFLQKQLSDAKCITEIEQQMIYQLPTERSKQFETLFQEIDSNLGKLDILSYGISISTLEDVFLKIGHLENPLQIFDPILAIDTTPESQRPLSRQSDIEKGADYQTNGDVEMKDQSQIEIKAKKNTFSYNLLTCLLKRFWIFKHNRKSIIAETIYPAAIIVYGVFLTKFIYKQRSPSRIQAPSRISSEIQPLLFNWNENVRGQGQTFQQQIMQSLTDDFSIQVINSTNMFTTRELIYSYGNQKVGQFPFLYSGYDFYISNTTSHQYQFYNHLNLTNQDAAGLFPQFMYEKILKVALKDPTIQFKTKSTPYPQISVTTQINEASSAGTIIFMTAVAYSTLLTLICSFLVHERVQGLKHIQVISGIQLKAYWIGNFLFDGMKIYVTVITTISLLWGQNLGYSSSQYVFIALPLAVLPFTYVQSFLFQSEASSQTYIMFGYFMSILTLPTIFFTLRAFPPFYIIGDVIQWILRLLLPTYCLGNSIYLDKSINLISDARSLNGKYLSKNRWDIQNVLGDLVCLLIQSVIWFTVLYLIERNQFKKAKSKQIDIQQKSEDSDVLKETERIQMQNDKKITLKVEQFSKTYPKKMSILNSQPDGQGDVIAVQNLNFGVDKGELFCLLGVNGAGKSTTFKALTCELQATSGKVEIQGKDITTSFQEIKTMIGYCPQWNSIFDSMTVQEHLNYYARAKGIQLQQQKQVIDELITELNLSDYRHKLAGNLSGGNKRKLSVAIAIIGRPPLILLDEPSAGMDPEARRLMWKVVAKLIRNKECAVVLTTHDMEEAEALCTKLGIMTKGGVLQCFGSAQHIRQKFGQGYLISIKTTENGSEPDSVSPSASLSPQQTQVLKELCREFQCVVSCLEQYGTFMKLRLAQQQDKMPLGKIFGVVERLKQEGLIIDYSVNQTTLEQIFQQFANQSETSSLRQFQIIEGELLETNVKLP